MAAGHTIDALGQFELHSVLGPVGASVGFSESTLMMVVSSALTLLLLGVGMSAKAVVPGRLQALAEMIYDFVHTMCIEQIGEEGKKFFPFIFTLFMFILLGNLLGLSWLLYCVAHETGLGIGTLTCISSMAQLETGAWSKSALKTMLAECADAYNGTAAWTNSPRWVREAIAG